MGKIISLADRLEKWQCAYTSSDEKMTFEVSSNGRIRVKTVNGTFDLTTFESVAMLSSLSEAMQTIFDGTLYET
jgi:hypothetical protein